MTTHSSRYVYCIDRLVIVGFLFVSASFATRSQANELKKVDQVVAAEAAGEPIDRRAALADQADETSQWQSGRILVNGKWLDFEDIQQHELGPQTKAYLRERVAIGDLNVEAHRQLAKWCQAHQMPEMAEVHWKAVVTVAVDDEQARKALGHRRIGNNWFSKDELKQAGDERKQEKAWLAEWMPQVRKIVAKLQSTDTQTKLEGIGDLEKIDTVDAVAALKYATLQLEPTLAIPIVSKIKSMRNKSCCLALCEIALEDPNSEVGRLAIEGLKEYDGHFYIPELLQMLQLPVEMKHQYFYMPNGFLIARSAYTRETMTEKELTEVLKLITVAQTQTIKYAGNLGVRASMTMLMEVNNAEARKAMEKLGEIEARRKNNELDVWNEIEERRQSNARTILAALSGVPSNAPASEFWNWWPNFNENFTSYVKPTNYNTVIDNSNYSTRSNLFISFLSCLVAGTKIQTSDGLKPIEGLSIGDIVVSTDVSSGQTTLRPITYLSNRTADATYVLTLDSGEVIRATGGHYWWVVGKGWQRSRELKPGQFMRTGDSSVKIAGVEKIDEPIKVYNMIVDENHTYFVGNDRLLSWDVTALQPTLQTAPGQTRSTYVSKK